jgi:hypothetical protein
VPPGLYTVTTTLTHSADNTLVSVGETFDLRGAGAPPVVPHARILNMHSVRLLPSVRMGRGARTRAAVTLTALFAVASCYTPSPGDCSYRCAATEPSCPSGLECDSATNLCRLPNAMVPCGGTGEDAGCSPPMASCSGAAGCVDLMNDPQHCGDCSIACASGVCTGGKCGHRVFVTNATSASNFGSGDSICQTAAEQRNLSGTFVAWVSRPSVGTTPETTLVNDGAPYVLLDGSVIATSWTDLTDGTNLAVTISLTEYGQPYTGTNLLVWTNTTTAGQTAATASDQNCFSFTIAGSGYTAVVGRLDRRDAMWTNASTANCYSDSAHLYCFENGS